MKRILIGFVLVVAAFTGEAEAGCPYSAPYNAPVYCAPPRVVPTPPQVWQDQQRYSYRYYDGIQRGGQYRGGNPRQDGGYQGGRSRGRR